MQKQNARSTLERREFLRMASVAVVGVGLSATSGIAAGANAAAPGANRAPGRGTRLILLGTAGGPPLRPFRFQPANLLVVDGSPYLIDAGYGCLKQLVEVGFRPEQLGAVFITHHHMDHDADLANIISYNWFGRRRTKLPIIGPHGTVNMVKASFAYLADSERIFGAEWPLNDPPSTFVEAKEITEDGEIYKDERIRVTAAENTHYQLMKPGPDRSCALRFDTAERSVVFTGDTGDSDAIVRLAKDADVLVSEVVDLDSIRKVVEGTMPKELATPMMEHMAKEHLPPDAVGKMAAAARAKMVVLTHVTAGADLAFDLHATIAEVKKHYQGPVIAGRDLLEV